MRLAGIDWRYFLTLSARTSCMPQIEHCAAGSPLVIQGCIGQLKRPLLTFGLESGPFPKKNQSVSPIRAIPPAVTLICARSMVSNSSLR